MTGTNLYVNKCKQSRSYLNHLVFRATCFDSESKHQHTYINKIQQDATDAGIY